MESVDKYKDEIIQPPTGDNMFEWCIKAMQSVESDVI